MTVASFPQYVSVWLAATLTAGRVAGNLHAGEGMPRGHPWTRHVIDDSSKGADGVRLQDVNGDGRPDCVTGWEEGGLTRVYLHPGAAAVCNRWPAVTVGKTPSVEDAVRVDLDGDGRTDVVSSCETAARQAKQLGHSLQHEMNRLLIHGVLHLLGRLERWPEVSGARPLTGNLAGWYRLRTGGYRVRFRVRGRTVTVDRIAHRRLFYDD